ncbi:hypothetical protein CHS0354_029030 [Potamilus streckersoni]|uniref:Nuclear autoantigenic sperm protein n=1 Tax=Potamilus streckersoni TaxID=2493646 RepID=A0AAE0VUI8_9BIVA|nr:hypothetical protein CHS0354_029030 [Potamilus streckersoni]
MAAEVCEGTSLTSDKERMEATVTAMNMIANGRRNVVCGEIPTAVNQFQEACKLLANAYGETAKECAEAYFYYGQALLDLARMETGVLGNALQGVPDTDEDEENKSSDDQFEKGDSLPESNEESESTEKENVTEEEEGEEEEEEETLDEGETSQDEKETKEGEESPDDISNLQLAWEMLELAKVIYLKDETKESKIKAAEAHLKLGEVSLETEQYQQAVEDFNQCLKIQKEYMEPEDRALAETYYQLGLAFGFNKQYDQAIESYKTAIKTIEDKIAKLTKFIEEKSSEKGKEPVDFDDPVTQAIQEVNDLKDILPDISTKIEDTEEERRQVDELKAAAKEVIGFTSSSVSLGQTMETSSTKSDVKVTDISHLIKRKRKPEEEEEEEAGEMKELKKTRQEDGSGDATTKENGIDPALEKDQPQDVPMEEANPAEVAAS